MASSSSGLPPSCSLPAAAAAAAAAAATTAARTPSQAEVMADLLRHAEKREKSAALQALERLGLNRRKRRELGQCVTQCADRGDARALQRLQEVAKKMQAGAGEARLRDDAASRAEAVEGALRLQASLSSGSLSLQEMGEKARSAIQADELIPADLRTSAMALSQALINRGVTSRELQQFGRDLQKCAGTLQQYKSLQNLTSTEEEKSPEERKDACDPVLSFYVEQLALPAAGSSERGSSVSSVIEEERQAENWRAQVKQAIGRFKEKALSQRSDLGDPSDLKDHLFLQQGTRSFSLIYRIHNQVVKISDPGFEGLWNEALIELFEKREKAKLLEVLQRYQRHPKAKEVHIEECILLLRRLSATALLKTDRFFFTLLAEEVNSLPRAVFWAITTAARETASLANNYHFNKLLPAIGAFLKACHSPSSPLREGEAERIVKRRDDAWSAVERQGLSVKAFHRFKSAYEAMLCDVLNDPLRKLSLYVIPLMTEHCRAVTLFNEVLRLSGESGINSSMGTLEKAWKRLEPFFFCFRRHVDFIEESLEESSAVFRVLHGFDLFIEQRCHTLAHLEEEWRKEGTNFKSFFIKKVVAFLGQLSPEEFNRLIADNPHYQEGMEGYKACRAVFHGSLRLHLEACETMLSYFAWERARASAAGAKPFVALLTGPAPAAPAALAAPAQSAPAAAAAATPAPTPAPSAVPAVPAAAQSAPAAAAAAALDPARVLDDVERAMKNFYSRLQSKVSNPGVKEALINAELQMEGVVRLMQRLRSGADLQATVSGIIVRSTRLLEQNLLALNLEIDPKLAAEVGDLFAHDLRELLQRCHEKVSEELGPYHVMTILNLRHGELQGRTAAFLELHRRCIPPSIQLLTDAFHLSQGKPINRQALVEELVTFCQGVFSTAEALLYAHSVQVGAPLRAATDTRENPLLAALFRKIRLAACPPAVRAVEDASIAGMETFLARYTLRPEERTRSYQTSLDNLQCVTLPWLKSELARHAALPPREALLHYTAVRELCQWIAEDLFKVMLTCRRIPFDAAEIQHQLMQYIDLLGIPIAFSREETSFLTEGRVVRRRLRYPERAISLPDEEKENGFGYAVRTSRNKEMPTPSLLPGETPDPETKKFLHFKLKAIADVATFLSTLEKVYAATQASSSSTQNKEKEKERG